ncbi:MAG: phosphatidylserine decarboxylase family protein [Bacteroidota bacterium]|nr:phosphatidylserine decarboxylase family protein [Bacteroidota bacterium]MEC8969371.1 phosphatidylserine decarboxylase family protein [Bacteroidota bacterium]
MRLHKEGTKIIIYTVLLLSAINLAFFQFLDVPFLNYTLLSISVVLLVLVLNFFRVPLRKVTINDKNILAPSDGKLVVIEQVQENEYLKEKCIQLSIFMSPLNVHKQWFPINGKVEYTKYHPGKYLVAWHPKSSTENERSTTVISSNNGTKILFRQIAGAVARRICNYANLGQTITQKDEAGFIKFGSRVDVFVPINATIKVKIGDKIIGGQTILATI